MKPELIDDDLLANRTPAWDSATIELINDHKRNINNQLKHLKRGRIILYALAGLSGLGVIFSSYVNPGDATLTEILVEGLLLVAIFGFSAVLFNNNPLVALIVGLSIYLINMLFAAMLLPDSVFRGIFLKLVVVIGLGRATYAALDMHSSMGALRELGVSKEKLKLVFRTLKPIALTFNPPR